MIWSQDDDYTWLESAWDENSIENNGPGWDSEIDRVRKMAYENKYEMRIQEVEVPGVFDLFDRPPVKAIQRGKSDAD